MKFTIRQLEYFIATAETGSITLASARVNISQPSISTAISHLEQEFGAQLFIRHHAQGLSITAAGRALLREARELVKKAENLYSTTADSSMSVRGVLSVGYMLTLAPIVMPELSQAFCKAFPETEIRQVAFNQEGLLEALRRGDIDVGITYDLDLASDVSFVPLVGLPPHAVCSASDPLRRKKIVTLKELVAQPMILLDLPLTRGYFLGLFMKENLSPTIVARSPHADVVRSMVGNGYGYALFNARPRCEVALDGTRLYRIRLAGPQPPLVLGIATLKQLQKTRIVQAFESHCRERISDNCIPGMAPLRAPRDRGAPRAG